MCRYAIELASSNPRPAGIEFDTASGNFSGFPTNYTIDHSGQATIVVIPYDANNVRGQGVNVVITVAPKEMPTAITFLDNNARAGVWNGTLQISPAASEVNFTYYLPFFSRFNSSHDVNQFPNNMVINKNGVSGGGARMSMSGSEIRSSCGFPLICMRLCQLG